jgi:hypothetical protein
VDLHISGICVRARRGRGQFARRAAQRLAAKSVVPALGVGDLDQLDDPARLEPQDVSEARFMGPACAPRRAAWTGGHRPAIRAEGSVARCRRHTPAPAREEGDHGVCVATVGELASSSARRRTACKTSRRISPEPARIAYQ